MDQITETQEETTYYLLHDTFVGSHSRDSSRGSRAVVVWDA